ncbi:hypothetical protein [Janthinobacterium sp.]|uniref:hypothetical protein n=1 Tax=Janthinobacterium sp. TaxID=1871054 RepID=UPI002588C55B|nr:hypothetical protein [Janthinobacterium sp.]MCX7293652.1 hypothetical protein [Janthinobacterium sp.]
MPPINPTAELRIAELESALAIAVAYLRALPLNPAHHHAAAAAEQVLRQPALPVQMLSGTAMASAGVPLLRATLQGHQLAVHTADPGTVPAAFREQHAAQLRAALIRGITIDLSHN